MKINIGFAITGSFCTHEQILEVISKMDKNKFNIIPIVTNETFTVSTRFGSNVEFLEKLEALCGNKIISTIVDAEPLGPKNMIDCLVIAPCTGNTLSKLNNGITNDAVTMTAKSLSRNNKPIIVGISTNDGLGLSMKNLAALMQVKNYFFIPFGQDNYQEKPKSLSCDLTRIEETIEKALQNEQVQPILI